METKHIIFLMAAIMIVPFSALMSSRFSVARNVLFFLIIFGTACRGEVYFFGYILPGQLDINFLSREFYRGSSRGIEIALIDLIALGLLLGDLMTPSERRAPRYWPASIIPMALFLAYACVSVAISDPKLFGVFELVKLVRGIIIFVAAARFVRGRKELEVLVFALCFVALYEAASALHQRYILGGHRVRGTLGSYTELSQYCCVLGPVLTAAAMSDIRKWLRWLAAISVPAAGLCAILAISRMGVATFPLAVGATALCCMTLEITPQKIGVVVLVVLAGAFVAYRSWDSLMGRFSQASIEEEFMTEGSGRGMYFQLTTMVVEDYPLGIGLNNWSYIVTRDYYPRLGLPSAPYTDTRIDMSGYSRNEMRHMIAPPAHNLFLLTVGELGYPGLIIFLSLWGRWLQMGATFLRNRTPMLLNRLGIGVLFTIVACGLHSITEYGYRHSTIYSLMQVLVGVLAAAYYYRKNFRPAPVRRLTPSFYENGTATRIGTGTATRVTR